MNLSRLWARARFNFWGYVGDRCFALAARFFCDKQRRRASKFSNYALACQHRQAVALGDLQGARR